MSKKEMRYYQADAIKAIGSGLSRGIDKQLLVMATGSGKTATATRAVDLLFPSERLLWGTHTEELIEQSGVALLAERDLMPYEDLLFLMDSHEGLMNLLTNTKRGGFFADPKSLLIEKSIGIVKAEMFDIDKPIVIASMQTLYRRLNRIPQDHFSVFVIDEAHYSGANTWMLSLNYFKVKLRLGLTATPYRMDGMLMGDIFDEIIYEYDIAKGVRDGYLCKIDAIRIATGVDLDKVRTTAGELNEKDLEETINTPVRNGLIVRKYKQYCEGRQFIASCANVKHAQDLCQAFLDEGIKCNYVIGDKEICTDRKGVIRDFKDAAWNGLCHVMVLTAGFDYSEISCMIQASPTKSLTKYLQQIGRGTRLKFGPFKDLIILDFEDTTKRHKLINCWELDKTKPLEDRIFISDEKKEKLRLDREAAMAAKQQSNTNELKQDQRVNLLKLPKMKVNESMRMREPASEAQLKWIAEEGGYDIVNVHYNKMQCNKIILGFKAAWKDIKLLKEYGYDISGGVTRGEAEQAKIEIENRKIHQQIKGATNLNIQL